MKKYKRILWFDLKKCFEDNRFIYLLAILLFLSAGVYFTKKTAGYGNAGIMDYYFNIISGIKKIDDSKIKEIPFVYIGFAVIFSYMTGRIMSYDGNVSFIIKSESRKRWLMMNLICLSANIILIYLVAFIICFIFSDKSVLFNNNIFELYFKTDYCMQKFDNLFQIITVLFIIPVLSSFSIAMIQILVSFIHKNVTGFVVSMIIYIFSMFDTGILFVGNGCMAYRSIFFMNGGIGIEPLITTDILIICFVLIIQLKIISIKDIL